MPIAGPPLVPCNTCTSSVPAAVGLVVATAFLVGNSVAISGCPLGSAGAFSSPASVEMSGCPDGNGASVLGAGF